MAELWTLDSKIVDAYWDAFGWTGSLLATGPMGCNRHELLMLMTNPSVGWEPFREVGDVLVLVNDQRPGLLLVVWKIPGY